MTAETVKADAKEAVKPFGYKDKFGYLAGEFGNNLLIALVNMMLLKFYTDVMELHAAAVGTLMTIVAMIAIFSNLVIGQLVDRSRVTPVGKFKPWVRRVAGPFALMTVLMYANWLAGASTSVKFGWLIVTYVLWLSVLYGSMEIPYGALAAVISADSEDRMRLSTYRHLGGMFGMSIVSIVLPMTVYYRDASGNAVLSGSRMMTFAIVAGIIAVCAYALLYLLTTERVRDHGPVADKFDWKAVGKAIVTNKALIAIIGVLLVRELSNTSMQGMASYMYSNYFATPAAQSIADVGATVLSLVCFSFMARLGIRFGKKETVAGGCLLITISMIIALILHTHNPYVWVGFYWVNTVGILAFGFLGWAFITDLIDDVEVRTGLRTEGTVTSVWNMSTQVGQALSSLVIGIMLSGIGYTAATKFEPEVVDRLYYIATIVPAVGFLITALILIFAFPLNKQRVLKNQEILAARRKSEDAGGESDADKAVEE